MTDWIRKNLVLVAGIVLPVLLVTAFFVLQRAPRMLADPPDHDFLIVAYRHDARHPRDFHLSFEVRDGRLYGRATPLGQGNAYPGRQHAALFRYEAGAHVFSEVTWDLPEGLDGLQEPATFAVDAVRGLRLDKARRSPDGYLFEFGGYRGRGGLLGELFGMGRRYDAPYVLERNGAIFRLPPIDTRPYYYGSDVHFLGWVLGEEDAS